MGGAERRWEDPWLQLPTSAAGGGELSEAAVTAAQEALTAMAADRTRVRNWLGAFVTTHAHVNVGGDGDEDFDDDGMA